MTATERGRSTRSTAATAATRSRSSNAPRVVAQLGRELELDPVRRGAHLDREAGLAEDADHAPVLGQDGRGEGRHAAGGRRPARGGAISTVARPRPCISSATAKATSARSGRSSSKTACATTRSSAPVVTISP